MKEVRQPTEITLIVTYPVCRNFFDSAREIILYRNKVDLIGVTVRFLMHGDFQFIKPRYFH